MVDNSVRRALQLSSVRFVIRPMLAAGGVAVDAISTSISRLTDTFIIDLRGEEIWTNGGFNLALTAVAGLAVAAVVIYASRFRRKSPWSRRKRKNILLPHQWENMFTPDGKIRDDGVQLLKKVRSGGIDPTIRSEVWPFLLGVYDFRSTKEERDAIISQKRKEYEILRKQCRRLLKHNSEVVKSNESGRSSAPVVGSICIGSDSPISEDVASTRESVSGDDGISDKDNVNHLTSSLNYEHDGSKRITESNAMVDEQDVSKQITVSNATIDEHGGCKQIAHSNSVIDEHDGSKRITDSNDASDSDSSETDSSDDPDQSQSFNLTGITEGSDLDSALNENTSSSDTDIKSNLQSREDFFTWQRIIRLDAIRANGEWMAYSSIQNPVSDAKAFRAAENVGLKDYEHLEPARIFHATRLVSILEAYALYDLEIGYCQGMSDLLSPIITVMSDDNEAFWCFVGFMKKARHNFRLDEIGIRRQLDIVSKIIKYKDSHLYKHLEKLQAEDCFFVYRMVVVVFRRELSFEQTVCLWEVMWADQAAIRAGIGKSSRSRMRQRIPPTEDLLLYAIAASVLQRRKEIIEKYNSMDEILRECIGMAGHLDVWKLLDDAHNLVVALHDKIETPPPPPPL